MTKSQRPPLSELSRLISSRSRKPDTALLTGTPRVFGRNHIVSLGQQERLAIRQARYDGLTGLIDRQEFDAKLASLHADAQEYATCYAMIVFNIADFSTICKYYGQDVADELLRQLAPLASHCLRGQDILSRCGDDKFAILMPDAHLADAIRLGKRLQQRFARIRLLGLQTTLNLGIVGYHPEDSADDMIAHAQSTFHQITSHGHQNLATQAWRYLS